MAESLYRPCRPELQAWVDPNGIRSDSDRISDEDPAVVPTFVVAQYPSSVEPDDDQKIELTESEARAIRDWLTRMLGEGA